MAINLKLLFCFFCIPFILFAQSKDIKFERISVEQGLSNGIVHCILQDHQGFMWFATEDGLNKYDGYKFTTYRHVPDDSTTLANNYITTIYEDQSGVLWIGIVAGGLNRFNREKETFTNYIYNPNNPAGINSRSLQHIVETRYGGKNVLWIGAKHGLNKMDITAKIFKHYPPTNQGHPYNFIHAVVIDSSRNVWIGCANGGIYKFDPETEQYTHYKHNPGNQNSLSHDQILSLYLDNSGILWIGTRGGGLNKFDLESEKFIRYKHESNNPYSLRNNVINSIYEDQSGVLWICTADGGLNRFNRETEQFIHYKHEPGNPNSLSSNNVMYIYEDKSGVHWVGTNNGLNKFDSRKTQFSDFRQIPGNSNSLSNNYITSVYESNCGENSVLWIGTKGGGFNKMNRKTGQITHYKNDPNDSKSLPSNIILSLCEDRSGKLWIGTLDHGLLKFDPETERFMQYLHDPADPKSISCNNINAIFEDNESVLWIATQTGGLNKFNRETGQFTLVGDRMQTMQIYEDKSDILWVASWSGLKKLDREREKLVTDEGINLGLIMSIFESRHGSSSEILWIGTYGGGLNKFDRESEKYSHYTTSDGLPSDMIMGILEDKNGNLWLSTTNGLSKFNPNTETFKNYDINDGLLSNQFNSGAYFKSKDDKMFFGGTNGLNAFYPDNIVDNPHIPKVIITDFQLFNEPVRIKKEDELENKYIYSLSNHISTLKEIELSYKENVFSFEFSALDYRSPEKNRYAYKMEGFESDWNYTGADRRFVTYTNLDPGNYEFKVKGSNNDGLWNEEGTSIKIIITPPWWKTNWAYAAYFILFAFTLYALRTYDKKRQRLKHELEMEHLHAEKLEEVDRLKSRFFANISHEFRTPLTLIKGPVKQIMSGEFKGNLVEQCRMILRNSDRLLKLINQLLDLSKLESGRMGLQVIETDLIKFIKGIVLSFSSLADRKKITLKFESTEKSLYGYIDCDKIEKIITNLLSNANKFTSEHGTIDVQACRGMAYHAHINNVIPAKAGIYNKKWIPHQVRDDNNTQFPVPNSDFVEITITNTGSGIPPDRLDKIFDRFYQVDDSITRHQEGTGIGLALTKELVELHHGTIDVQSGKGTVHRAPTDSESDVTTIFTIQLPISEEYFNPDEIVEEMEAADKTTETAIWRPQTGIESELNNQSLTSGLRSPVSDIRSAASGLQPPLVLIVEDNPDVISYIRSFLDQDYRVITAINGVDGWQKALEKYPDLIISDVMMPEMDGFELCHKLKSDENTCHIPVILLTAKADLDSRIEGLGFGADDYISKPFEARELQARAKNLIEQRQKLWEKFSQTIEINPGEIATSSMDEQFLKRLLDVFETHVAESDFSTEDFAREVGMSRSNLHRKLQALTNQPTHEFLRTLRLKRAAQLLQKSTGTVTEIAYAVGFNNLSHFTKIFSQHFGKTPSQFASKNQ